MYYQDTIIVKSIKTNAVLTSLIRPLDMSGFFLSLTAIILKITNEIYDNKKSYGFFSHA